MERKINLSQSHDKDQKIKKLNSAYEVANYFLYRGEKDRERLSNLKLQKLIYYAQGIHLALFGKPIFKENIVAWNYGPVIPELYAKYKSYGSRGIPVNKSFDPQSINDELRNFLEEIYIAFGQFSATRLIDFAHADKCWQEAFPNKVIKLSAMAVDLKKYLKNGQK